MIAKKYNSYVFWESQVVECPMGSLYIYAIYMQYVPLIGEKSL